MVLLARRRSFLSTAFLGVIITTVLMALGLSQVGEERMGLAEIGEQSLGTPGQLGIPAVLVLLLAASENGRWMMLDRAPALRLAVIGTAALTMLFTVHRTGWVLAIIGLTVLFLANPRRQIKPLLTAIPVVAAMIVLALATDRGATIEKYFWKVMDDDRTWNQRTTGRLDQWKMFPEILAGAPILGHGPGSARKFDKRRDGVELTLHSSYMHIGAETGLVGLGAYLLLLGGAFFRTVRYRELTGDATPLVLLVCMAADGLSHNNFSPLLGIFLGVALASGNLTGLFVRRDPRDLEPPSGASGLLRAPA